LLRLCVSSFARLSGRLTFVSGSSIASLLLRFEHQFEQLRRENSPPPLVIPPATARIPRVKLTDCTKIGAGMLRLDCTKVKAVFRDVFSCVTLI
jgi:hypothetical protein